MLCRAVGAPDGHNQKNLPLKGLGEGSGEFARWIIAQISLIPDERIDFFSQKLPAARVILRVGITRKFTGSDEYDPAHWLMVDNIHLDDDPLWQLG